VPVDQRRSKKYRRDLRIIATSADNPNNHNDPVHYRWSLCKTTNVSWRTADIEECPSLSFRRNRIVRDRAWRRHRRRRARVEHAIARLETWRVLRDHRRRGHHLAQTLQAITVLHNLQVNLRDKR